jgi:hypothetical protein
MAYFNLQSQNKPVEAAVSHEDVTLQDGGSLTNT